jgi:GT2 family glycosyltransferase
MISVVIPARDSQDTIRITIDTLYCQTRKPDEVIIVVCPGDFTHTAIEDYIGKGFVRILSVEAPKEYIRDAQWKRWIGMQAARGDIIFLTDSKVVLEEHALENAFNLMVENGVDVVGGITPAWPDQMENFWAKLHDNALITNLPVFPRIGMLTAQNFGKTESLPVTTALLMKRKVFDAVAEDFALDFSKVASTYDDYVLSWLIVEAGFPILVTNRVIAHHKHRLSWKGYSTQISRSGQSAAIMARMYPDCPFGTRRLRQVAVITLALTLGVLVGVSAFIALGNLVIGYGLLFVLLVLTLLGVVNVVRAKELKAFVFPVFTILLILTFSLHFTKNYTRTEYQPQEVASYLQIH